MGAWVAQSGAVGGVLVWMGVLAVVAVGGGMVMLWVRRRALSRGESASAEGFMESLRRMRDEGSISEEEFRAARARLLGMEVPAGGVPGRGAGAGERRAAPGFDLTGEPLPPFGGNSDRGGGGGGI